MGSYRNEWKWGQSLQRWPWYGIYKRNSEKKKKEQLYVQPNLCRVPIKLSLLPFIMIWFKSTQKKKKKKRSTPLKRYVKYLELWITLHTFTVTKMKTNGKRNMEGKRMRERKHKVKKRRYRMTSVRWQSRRYQPSGSCQKQLTIQKWK